MLTYFAIFAAGFVAGIVVLLGVAAASARLGDGMDNVDMERL